MRFIRRSDFRYPIFFEALYSEGDRGGFVGRWNAAEHKPTCRTGLRFTGTAGRVGGNVC